LVRLPWAGRLRTFDEVQNGTSHLLKVGLGVDARPVGTFVQNSDHRNRISVLDAGSQIELAGNRHDGVGSILQDNSPGQRPSGGHGDLQVILIGELDQVFDFAFSAAFAVSDIPCDLDLAVEVLNAVGKEDQEFIGTDPVPVGSDQMVVQLDERLLNFVFRYPDDLSHQDHQGEKDLGNKTSQPVRKEDVFSPEDGEDKEQTAENHEEDQQGEGQTEDRRERGMDVFQPDDRNIPEKKDETKKNDAGKNQQPHEGPFFRPVLQCSPLRLRVSGQIRMSRIEPTRKYFNKF